jgi:hypothetical protein
VNKKVLKHWLQVAERLLKVYANTNPNFEFHVVEGGHHVHLNEPGKVAPLILNFLRKNFRLQVSVLYNFYFFITDGCTK